MLGALVDALELLAKGRPAKYIRRVAKAGGGYRYFYRMTPHQSIGMRDFSLHVEDHGGDTVKVSEHADGHGTEIPRASLKHFVNDLHGRVAVPSGHERPEIAAVVSGKAKMLGKGDDGIAFKVGDKVVKVSTTVPYQPFNLGHRTPDGAAAMLKDQVETGNRLADLGVPALRSEYVRHGDKGFQIKPYVEIPEKLTKAQLDEAQAAIHAMHAHGYALNDAVQVGLLNDRVVLYDTGKAAKARGTGYHSDAAADIDRLAVLYRASGVPFSNHKEPAGAKAWATAQSRVLAVQGGKARAGGPGGAAWHVDRASDLRRADARATLTGKELESEFATIGEEQEWAHEDLRSATAKLRAH